MFPENTKVLRQTAYYQDYYELQHDLNEMKRWSNNWPLSFNPYKCKVITLGAFENIMYTHCYTISGHELEHTEYERDLCITVDSTLKFEQDLEKIKLANLMMGLIRHAFSHLSSRMLVPLYMAFVCSNQ